MVNKLTIFIFLNFQHHILQLVAVDLYVYFYGRIGRFDKKKIKLKVKSNIFIHWKKISILITLTCQKLSIKLPLPLQAFLNVINWISFTLQL